MVYGSGGPMDDKVGRIDLIDAEEGPSVRFDATDYFMRMSPLDRATYFMAAVQLCELAIDLICEDHPEYEEQIIEREASMLIQPGGNRKIN
jgi:hypothetical protein